MTNNFELKSVHLQFASRASTASEKDNQISIIVPPGQAVKIIQSCLGENLNPVESETIAHLKNALAMLDGEEKKDKNAE